MKDDTANSVTSHWYNEEHTIIEMMFQQKWSIDALYQVIPSTTAMIESVDHNVYMIIFFGRTNLIPEKLLSFLRNNLTTRPWAKNFIFAITVTDNSFVKIMFRMVWQLIPESKERYRLAATLEEALAVIQAHQQSPS